MYKVIEDFIDIDGINYYKGEVYPFINIEISENHFNYLLSDKNKLSKPVIKKIEDTKDVEDEKTKRTRKRTTKNSKA